jgi:enediyne polyketide synthase
MSCRYADADTPRQLWENVLAQRRAFRRLPAERLRLEDYFDPQGRDPDKTYSAQAALIEGYEFDRVRFRIGGEVFRSTDMTHWLALDVAAEALADAGFESGDGLPRDTTGVFLGNTLTGEFSRANVLRLRWPYVRRVVGATLAQEGLSPERQGALVTRLEALYKKPFPPIGEDTLAGGLSNTIAGRICNHFDLHGGGYTVDGACASSLLAVTNACAALVAGDLDVALAGGVDLSLDPFELVGFARAGALAREEMRVYDRHAAGFLPGEGCGWLVLTRYEDALAQGRRVYAVIRGWGISSDGGGGLTRPEVKGQTLALARAYRRAGYGIETVSYFEGHGTGTLLGDEVELTALDHSRRATGQPTSRAALGSVKANIGHTKAAAGVAGLIKAALALHAQVVPPTTGCHEPHRILAAPDSTLRTPKEGEAWPDGEPLRAGVSAMGFGGINTHLTLEGVSSERRTRLSQCERELSSSPQDAELFLLDAGDGTTLLAKVDSLRRFVARLSRAEMTDLAARLVEGLVGGDFRAAVVASGPSELEERLGALRRRIEAGRFEPLEPETGVFLGQTVSDSVPSIVFLFPGQGSPTRLDGGMWQRRFRCVREVYEHLTLPAAVDASATHLAQPAIVAASLAALRVLERLGIEAVGAVGHSLGEINALGWAGVMDDEACLRIATVRGRAMMELGDKGGAMLSVAAGGEQVAALLNGRRVVIAGFNSPTQTVVSGESSAIRDFAARAESAGLRVSTLPVSHAFHSPLVAPAVSALARCLSSETFSTLRRHITSTVTGERLRRDVDVVGLLCRQVTAPVRFIEAARAACEHADLAIEVGPGQVLCGLLRDFTTCPSIALDAGGASLKGLLLAAGAAFALGAQLDGEFLFADRFTRSFDLDWHPKFFANPCELAPSNELDDAPDDARKAATALERNAATAPAQASPLMPHRAWSPEESFSADQTQTPLSVVRQLVAQRTELPVEAVRDESRLLSDLHLNSITVGQLVAEAARRLALSPPRMLTEFANVTVSELADVLDELKRTGEVVTRSNGLPEGLGAWVRAFTVALVERPLPARQTQTAQGGVWRLFAPRGYALAELYGRAFAQVSGGGVLVCLPAELGAEHVGLLLDAARAALQDRGKSRFVLVQHGESATSLAQTLHLEAPWIQTCVVTVPEEERAVGRVVAEAEAVVEGYTEALYDEQGRRFEPQLRVLPTCDEPTAWPLCADDVLLVTGGGKGVAAECALSLARATGVRLAIVGRARPETDAELAANLERFAVCGIDFRYFSADVTDAEAVRAAVGEAESMLGPITAFLHGAGINTPTPLSELDEQAFIRTLGPKVRGARNVLAALDPQRLRLFVTFGSIIGRMGMAAEADYAVANEWLTNLTRRWQLEHTHCRCMALEWSVWSGVGMGERLGSVERLTRAGVSSISIDEGVRVLHELMRRTLPSVSVVVTGRPGSLPTLKVETPELPFLRFLETPRVYYPGVELVADVELSLESDPYLEEHALRGDRLFPAVLGLEAMAQAAMALASTDEIPVFEDIAFESPLVVGEDERLTLRVAALKRAPGRIEVVLRSETTSFKLDHFKATCSFGASFHMPVDGDEPRPGALPEVDGQPLGLDAAADLYETILFHRGRFRRIKDYWRLSAKECLAELTPTRAQGWFGRYLPARLVLGDPAVRDAAIHAIQACIPQATLLPTGVARLTLGIKDGSGPYRISARERLRRGDEFIYDVDIIGEDGAVCEHWEGLTLKLVGRETFRGPWAAPLLGPLFERRVEESLAVSDVRVALETGGGAEQRGVRGMRALRRALGFEATIRYRPDGKPEVVCPPGWQVSVSHSDALSVAVAGRRAVGCDVEVVGQRAPFEWLGLLGSERAALAHLISERGEDEHVAATRVWAAAECLRKVGAGSSAPLILVPFEAEGWVRLASGSLAVLTYVFQLRDTVSSHLALAVLVDTEQRLVPASEHGEWSSSHHLNNLEAHTAPVQGAEQETAR